MNKKTFNVNPPYINADPLRNTKKEAVLKSNFIFNSPSYRHFKP